LKFIAPLITSRNQIEQFKNSITKKAVLFSEKQESLADFDVFHRHHRYSNQNLQLCRHRFCGWWFGNPGVHNLLEPATFGVPIIVGPNYSHFAEAIALVNMGGCISVSKKGVKRCT
jgi:3-deoxy-D-manno-octulosonic-acid transferase